VGKKVIQILVDRDCTPPGQPGPVYVRTSLWMNFLRNLNRSSDFNISDFDIKEISIYERKRKKPDPEPTRIDDGQILIVNWDAANGDYLCGSDDVFLYFQTQRDKRNALLRQRRIPPGPAPGGKILCEFQCGSGMLFQGAYDAIFGESEVKVVEARLPPEARPKNEEMRKCQLEEERKWTNTSAVVPWHFLNHPIVRALPGKKVTLFSRILWARTKVESKYGEESQPLFNFKTDMDQEDFFSYRQRDTIYRGWFENWGKEWVPLLIAKPREEGAWARFKRWRKEPPRAVLLAKCHEDGVMLASTMWMAVPGAEDLVRQILTVDPKVVAKAHDKYFLCRKIFDRSLVILVYFALGVVNRAWGSVIHAFLSSHLPCLLWLLQLLFHLPHLIFGFVFPSLADSPLLDDVGVVWLSLIIYRLWQTMIRDRPHGVNIFQFAKSGRQAFWDRM